MQESERPETEEAEKPDIFALKEDDDRLAAALNDLQEKASEDQLGKLGKLFGGAVNAANNIHGAVILIALLAIVGFGLLKPDSLAIIDVLKAVLFLALGALAPKIKGRSE